MQKHYGTACKLAVGFAIIPLALTLGMMPASAGKTAMTPAQKSEQHVIKKPFQHKTKMTKTQQQTMMSGSQQPPTMSQAQVGMGKSPMTSMETNLLGVQGQWYLVTGHYPESISAYQKLLSTEPNNVQALNGMATALHYQGRYNEALQFISRAIALDPVNSRLFYTKGQIMDAQDKPVEAIDAYLTFTSLDPDDGAALSAQRRAEELYKRVEPQLSPSLVHYFQGMRMLSLHQPEQAIGLFEKFSALEPSNQEGKVLMGRAYLDMGQPEKAIACFEEALKMQSDNPMAYYQLGSSYELRGETQNAKEAWRKFLQYAPQSESAMKLNRMLEISQK